MTVRSTATSFAATILGGRTLGTLEYLLFPKRGVAWGGPFNGQQARQALFEALLASIKPSAVVETGTYLGTTTEVFASTGLPVHTVENDDRRYGFASTRFLMKRNVRVWHADSRSALEAIFAGPLSSAGTTFVYLDAHWNQDLPLAKEIEIVFASCPCAVVMIDDFQVPGDVGYRFDDYGSGKALTGAYIADVLEAQHLAAFYPATPSDEETGSKRGCVILVKDDSHKLALSSLPLLRPAPTEGRSARTSR